MVIKRVILVGRIIKMKSQKSRRNRIFLRNTLRHDSHFIINKSLLAYLKDWELVGYLSYLIGIENYFITNNKAFEYHGSKWFFNQRKSIEKYTGIKETKQKKFSGILVKKGILKVKKMGIPAKNYYQINHDKLLTILEKDNYENYE